MWIFHNLFHLADYVEWWAPMWACSCFGFESLNGSILNLTQIYGKGSCDISSHSKIR